MNRKVAKTLARLFETKREKNYSERIQGQISHSELEYLEIFAWALFSEHCSVTLAKYALECPNLWTSALDKILGALNLLDHFPWVLISFAWILASAFSSVMLLFYPSVSSRTLVLWLFEHCARIWFLNIRLKFKPWIWFSRFTFDLDCYKWLEIRLNSLVFKQIPRLF